MAAEQTSSKHGDRYGRHEVIMALWDVAVGGC
jgi:hypothetical protein